MMKSTHAKVLNFFIFSILTTINRSICTRPLVDTAHALTFFINDVLSNRNTSTPSAINGVHVHAPLFNHGGRSSTTDARAATFGPSVRARAGARIGWLSVLTSVGTLESGNVTVIDVELSGTVAVGPPLVGKLQGISVTSEMYSHSHMVAMREHHRGISESHIAVVGGTGRYEGANGFAVITAVHEEGNVKRKLKFTVHIK